MFESNQITKLTNPLLKWFQENARQLPWREQPQAYQVWVSEIMLQQTRVEAVKPYYLRFLQELPDIKSLAECKEDRLLKLWEGLGYYSRVRNMQKAAITVMEEYGGNLPDTYEELLQLCGIGSYTAGAIASIAFQRPVPAVDGNVLRVLMRVTGEREDIAKEKVKKEVEKVLLRVIPKENPGTYNQALMELGATVCVPNGAPMCEACPWKEMCVAFSQKSYMELPVKSGKKTRKIEERTVFLIRKENQVVLKKRENKGLLAGMYEFPNELQTFTEEQVREWLLQKDYKALRIKKIMQAKHIFSHVEWHMTGYEIWVDELEESALDMEFIKLSEMKEKYAVPSAFSAYLRHLNELHS